MNYIYNCNENIDLSNIKDLYANYKTTMTEVELLNKLNNINYQYSKNSNIRQLYNYLITHRYPNESVIKSAFINNILIKSNNHVTIFELAVGNSRVDLCKIDSTSIGYEIKTEYDNYERLSKQLLDYLSVFDLAYVICPRKHVESISSLIPNECGIYAYHINKQNKYIFKKVKFAQKSIYKDSTKQLNLLTKKKLIDMFNIPDLDSKEDIICTINHKYSSRYINTTIKKALKSKYYTNWMFLKNNIDRIFELDYQWFFKHRINPEIIYQEFKD